MMNGKLTLVSLSLWACTAFARPIDWNAAEDIAPGVKAVEFRETHPRLMECRLLRVDLRQKGLSFVSTERAAEWGQPMPYVTNRTILVDTRRETTEAFMRRKRAEGLNVVAAVNTAPWIPWEAPWTHRFGRMLHLAVADGEAISHVRQAGATLVIWNDNTAVITNALAEADFGRVAAAHSGFTVIMRGGAVPSRKSNGGGPYPRTAFGISADGRHLFVLVIDGRQDAWSRGADMIDLCEMLKDAGASDAVNMDGGGSVSLVTLGPDGKTIVHRNRHEPTFRAYRPVALNLGIVVRQDER